MSDRMMHPSSAHCITLPECHPHLCAVAALRTALVYLESPRDLGQQICGIRPVARMLRNT